MKKNRVFWTPVAIKSLEETKNFIIKHWNDQVLEYFLDLIDKRIEQVQINPRIAPVIIESDYRKLVIHKNISLFYIIESSLTNILLVWDNRQNPKELKRKLTDAQRKST